MTLSPAIRTGMADGYDDIAWFCDTHGREAAAKLSDLPREGRILDLRRGAGHLAAALCQRGYDVTGLDASEETLRLAHANTPSAQFACADARSFRLPVSCDAVVSAGDSVNYLLTQEELTRCVRSAFRALRPGDSRSAMHGVGFGGIRMYRAGAFGVQGRLGAGRVFVVAHRPAPEAARPGSAAAVNRGFAYA